MYKYTCYNIYVIKSIIVLLMLYILVFVFMLIFIYGMLLVKTVCDGIQGEFVRLTIYEAPNLLYT